SQHAGLQLPSKLELQCVVVVETAVLDQIRHVNARVLEKHRTRVRADIRAGGCFVQIGERGHLPRLDQASDRGTGEKTAAEAWNDRQRLAAGKRGVEGGIEDAGRLQCEKTVAARTKEIVLKRAMRVHLIEIDAAPQSAAECSDVSRLCREPPWQFARDA